MKKSRLFLKIGAGALAFGLIAFCCMLTMQFLGNPIEMLLAKNTAKAYAEKTYPSLSLEVGEVGYNFKFGEYFVPLHSAKSADTAFTVYIKNGTTVRSDSYERDVEKHGNTIARLTGLYQQKVDPLLAALPGMENHTSFFDCSEKNEGGTPDYAKLSLDMPFSMQAVEALRGELLLRTATDEMTPENAAHILKLAQSALAAERCEPSYYSIFLESGASIGEYLFISSRAYSAEELREMDEAALAAEIRTQNEDYFFGKDDEEADPK